MQDAEENPEENLEESPVEPPKKPKKSLKKKILIISLMLITIIGTALAVFFLFIRPQLTPFEETHVSKSSDTTPPKKYYDALTGEEIADDSQNNAPIYCIQMPNGMDVSYPRVHAGLHDAKIVFEAIAEAGITRFAAIYQNPTNSIIGPIRSLRMYYLDWDIPFDCNIVHAGGSWDAVAAARNYRDLTENYTYMFRDYSTYLAPNNLMTTPALLNQFNADAGFGNSNPLTFSRLKPKQVPATPEEPITTINLNFGYTPYYNLIYTYDETTNSYTRAYASGEAHSSYACSGEATRPSTECETVPLTPKVVIALMVSQYTDTDGYHQVIGTTGSGQAYIFQNGTVVEGTWEKPTKEDQLTFKDQLGNEIFLTPGQTWLHALPTSTGSVSY